MALPMARRRSHPKRRRRTWRCPPASTPASAVWPRRPVPGPAPIARSSRAPVEHLRSGYRYTLDVGRFKGQDPLAEFLFEKRAGYCEYFASAAGDLLRLQGVRSRYVKGGAVRRERRVAGHYVARESDAHAPARVLRPALDVRLPRGGPAGENGPRPPALRRPPHAQQGCGPALRHGPLRWADGGHVP